MEVFAALFVMGALILILRFAVSSDRHVLTGRWFPREDRGIGATRERTPWTRGAPHAPTPWPRGAMLAALATAPIAGLAADAGTGAGLLTVAIFGAFSAIAFRAVPLLTGPLLGVLGSLFALTRGLAPACADPAGSRIITVSIVVLLGLAVFFVVAAVRVSGLLLLIRVQAASIPLAAFGVIELGVFVGGPFGLDLAGLTGFSGPFLAAVALYLLICAGAGLLPEFTTSVLGAALLATHAVVDFMIGDPCSGRTGVLLATLLGFVAVWTVSRRVGR